MYLKILSTIPALEAAEGETNAGGLRRLRLMPADYVQMILRPDWYPGPEQADLGAMLIDGQSIVILDDARFIDVEIMPEYASYSEDMDTSVNGEFYKPTIQLALPKDRPAVSAWLHRYRSVRWVALIQDGNGQNRLVGSPEQPLRLTVQNSLGAGQRGRNARSLTFSALSAQPALYLTSIEDDDLIYPCEFDISFAFAYNS